MSMQTAGHPSMSAPYPHHTAYPSHVDQRSSMSGPPPQGAPMAPGAVPQTAVEPEKLKGTRGNYQFELVIDQEPIRARMCGFGDKDRRPITPPPCVRVIITDLTTGQQVPADQIDPAFFLLSVDLWDESASGEKNIVRSASNSPAVSISTATTTSFPVPPERPMYTAAPPMYQQQYQQGYPPGPVYQQQQGHPSMYQGAPGQFYPPGYPAQPYGAQAPPPGSPAYPQQFGQSPAYSTASQPSSGMFTRNLIGSLAVNAFTLNDLEEKKGHWFVLQDLSVRTEGTFRLKMSFIDLGTHLNPVGKEENKLNCGKTDVLATAFSKPFQVFSAKKFPGVIESTPLSKKFASQGIKIPIRKDGMKGGDKGDHDDED